MYSNPPMDYAYHTLSSHQWSIPPTYSSPTPTPSFPSFPWELFTPYYTHGSSSPKFYLNHGYSPHPSYPNPYSLSHYSNPYNNYHQLLQPTKTSNKIRRDFVKHLQVPHPSFKKKSQTKTSTKHYSTKSLKLIEPTPTPTLSSFPPNPFPEPPDRGSRNTHKSFTFFQSPMAPETRNKSSKPTKLKKAEIKVQIVPVKSDSSSESEEEAPPQHLELDNGGSDSGSDSDSSIPLQHNREHPFSKPPKHKPLKICADVGIYSYKPSNITSDDNIYEILRNRDHDSKFCFNIDIDSFPVPKGLYHETIRSILTLKSEPDWMLNLCLHTFEKFSKMKEPNWSDNSYPAINFQDICYYSALKKKPSLNSLEEVDTELLRYFDELGVLLNEKNRFVTVAVDVILDSGAIATTHRKTLVKAGANFCLISESIRKYPDLVKKYFGKFVPSEGNYYAALIPNTDPYDPGPPKSLLTVSIMFSVRSVYESHRRFGKVRNTESHVNCDVVIAVPDSSVVAELGNSKKKPLNFPVIMRKELTDTMRALVRSITMVMIHSVYFKSIIKLLHHSDKNVGKKALGLLCDAARNHEKLSVALKDNKGSRSRSSFPGLHMDKSSQESLDKMCLEILQVLDESSNTSLKVAAVSTLEVLPERFPSNSSIFGVCLGSITKCITSHNLAVNSRCLRTSAALINVLGPKALAEASAIVLSFSVLAFSSFTIPFNGHFVSNLLSVSIATVIGIVFTSNNYNDTLITFHSSNNISMPQVQPSQHALPWYCHWTLLPQHLAVHPYSQLTLPFGHFTDIGAATPAGLVAASQSHAFALFVAVSVGANISGGHVNLAVTFGAFVGGYITLVRGLLYWIAQLLGFVVACLLLKIATGGLETSAFSLSSIGESGSNFRTLRTRFK